MTTREQATPAERESDRIRAAARARMAATMPPMSDEAAARIAPLILAGLERVDRDEKERTERERGAA